MRKTPKAPRGLCSEAQKLWKYVRQNYDLDGDSIEILATACHSLTRYYQVKDELTETGLTFTNSKTGTIHKNPLCQIEKDAHGSFMAAMKLLNLIHDDDPKPGRPGGYGP